MISIAPDGRIAILDGESGTFGQFDSAGNWHEGKIPSADEYMEDFGPLVSPTLRALYLSRARAASEAQPTSESARALKRMSTRQRPTQGRHAFEIGFRLYQSAARSEDFIPGGARAPFLQGVATELPRMLEQIARRNILPWRAAVGHRRRASAISGLQPPEIRMDAPPRPTSKYRKRHLSGATAPIFCACAGTCPQHCRTRADGVRTPEPGRDWEEEGATLVFLQHHRAALLRLDEGLERLT